MDRGVQLIIFAGLLAVVVAAVWWRLARILWTAASPSPSSQAPEPGS